MKRVDVRLRLGPGEELPVGTLALAARGRLYFEFAGEFMARDLEISPWKLGARTGLIEHTDLGFGPLFGVFDDSLPDAWGRLLMDRTLRRRGVNPRSVTVLDRLLFLGARTVGALTYHPPEDDAPASVAALELEALAREARRVLAKTHSISRKQARRVVEQVNDALADWPALAGASGCSERRIAEVAADHHRLA